MKTKLESESAAAGPPEGTYAEPGEQQGQGRGEVNPVHHRFSGKYGLVFTPRGTPAYHPENEEKEASYLEPKDMGGSPDGLRGSRQTRSGGTQKLVPGLRVKGVTGDGTQTGADSSTYGAILARFAQSMILRSETNKNVPPRWDGQIFASPFASKYLRSGRLSQEGHEGF